MTNRLRKVSTYAIIDDDYFPLGSWSCTLPNQGAMGTATLKGAYSDLLISDVDLIEAIRADGAPVEIYYGYDGDEKLVFSGVADGCDFDIEEDWFEVKARDAASYLADGKQTMAGLKVRNQSVKDIVQQIADKFGFEADITDTKTKAGPLMNGEHFYNPQPRTYWNMLQELAEDAGFECYFTPEQKLYFGPEKEQGKIEVNYCAKGSNKADVKNPAWGMNLSYSPRENSNVEVRAISYNPQTTQKVDHQVTAEQIMLEAGKKKKTRKSRKKKGPIVVKSKGGRKKRGRSIQYIRCPGLTPEQAKAKCQGVADALAKRQVIISFKIEGNTDVKVHSEITLKESPTHPGILYGFDGVPLNVAEVTHSFEMSDGDGGGLITSIRAIAQIEGGG